ncbi:hypothetical protein [Xanthomonas vasicola]|uniref:hypothetical protein n=1 Tax=Xanthomonas vasicola TaxID=56459 RepID=UPI001C94DBDA|nr:hypothetical protein [Xanthomonas vasicola]
MRSLGGWGFSGATGYPLHRDVLRKCAQVGKVEELTKVEQLLVDGYKKSDARGWHRILGDTVASVNSITAVPGLLVAANA